MLHVSVAGEQRLLVLVRDGGQSINQSDDFILKARDDPLKVKALIQSNLVVAASSSPVFSCAFFKRTA